MSKLGAHVQATGPRNGYGSFCDAKPAVVLSNGDGGALIEAAQRSGNYTYTIFRHTLYKDSPPDIDRMTPSQARDLADSWYPELKMKWVQNPANYYIVLNEPAGNDTSVLPSYLAYELRMMELAEADGYRLCVLNLAGGTPGDYEAWKALYVPHIKRAFEGGHVYGRHCYGGYALSTPDGNTNRAFVEAEYLRSVGLGYGGIVITEAGQNGGFGYVGDSAFVTDAIAYNEQMMAHSNIIGACLWTLGNWDNHNANWQSAIPSLALWMGNNKTPRWKPGIPTAPLPKVVVVKKPAKAEMTEAENDAANAYAWSNYGRTTSHSIDDMTTLLRFGNEESYAIVAYPERPSQVATIAALQDEGFNWVAWPQPAPEFAFTHWPTGYKVVNQRFRANPGYYGQFGLPGHEGVDIKAPMSGRIFAVAKGTVVDIHSNPGDHNYGIHVRINHADGWQTIYAHLFSTSVIVGQSVGGGQVIGLADSTGNSTGSHLHITLKRLGHSYIDPVLGVTWPYNIFDPEPQLVRLAPEAFPPAPVPSIDLRPFIIADPTCWRVVRSQGGAQEDVQDMILENGLFVRRKNNLAEWWRMGDQYYYLIHDTSPSPGSQGIERVYTLTRNGFPGAPMMPLALGMNQPWSESGTHHVQFRSKTNCSPLSENSGEATNTASLIRRERNYVFNSYGQNLMIDEAIWIKTAGGEIQIYGRKNGKSCGWIGWEAPWGRSEVVEIHWDRPAMTTEPNRFCSW